jgi:hypothetical protein
MSTTVTFNDWVEKVYRRTTGTSVDVAVYLQGIYNGTAVVTGSCGAGDTQLAVSSSDSGITGLRVGALLSCDYELMMITAITTVTSYTVVTVVRGYNGSAAATHNQNASVFIQPRYTRFDIGVALNDELRRLSSPDNGLFQVKELTITYNPVYMGYDLGQAATDNFIDILEIRHKIPFPSRNYPKIGKWKVLRSIPDSTIFPSGQGIVFYEGGYPGQPVYVQYSAPFTPVDLTNPTAFTTDIGTLTGMTDTMSDIPPLGVEIQLTLPREIRRNFMDVQPDPRKAPEVPSLAVSNSVQAMQIVYNQRVSEEAGRLSRQYTRTESW